MIFLDVLFLLSPMQLLPWSTDLALDLHTTAQYVYSHLTYGESVCTPFVCHTF